MEFKYNMEEGALSVTPEYYHFKSGSEKLLTLNIANNLQLKLIQKFLYMTQVATRVVEVRTVG